jgi:hypothetical protein
MDFSEIHTAFIIRAMMETSIYINETYIPESSHFQTWVSSNISPQFHSLHKIAVSKITSGQTSRIGAMCSQCSEDQPQPHQDGYYKVKLLKNFTSIIASCQLLSSGLWHWRWRWYDTRFQDHVVSQRRRPPSTSSLLWEPHVSCYWKLVVFPRWN